MKKKSTILPFLILQGILILLVAVMYQEGEYKKEYTAYCENILESDRQIVETTAEIDSYQTQLNNVESQIKLYEEKLEPLNDVNEVLTTNKSKLDLVRNFPTVYYTTQYDSTGIKATIASNRVADLLQMSTAAVPGVGVITAILANCAKYNNKYYYDYMVYANETMQENISQPLANFSNSMMNLRTKIDYYDTITSEDIDTTAKFLNADIVKDSNIEESLNNSFDDVAYDAAILNLHYSAMYRVYSFILDMYADENIDYLNDLSDVINKTDELVRTLTLKSPEELLSKEEILAIQKPYLDTLVNVIDRSSTAALGADITGMQMYRHQVYDRESHGLSDFKLGIYSKCDTDMKYHVVKHFADKAKGFEFTCYYDMFGDPVYCNINGTPIYFSGDICLNEDIDQSLIQPLMTALKTIQTSVKHKDDTELFCETMSPFIKAISD